MKFSPCIASLSNAYGIVSPRQWFATLHDNHVRAIIKVWISVITMKNKVSRLWPRVLPFTELLSSFVNLLLKATPRFWLHITTIRLLIPHSVYPLARTRLTTDLFPCAGSLTKFVYTFRLKFKWDKKMGQNNRHATWKLVYICDPILSWLLTVTEIHSVLADWRTVI